MEFMDLYIFAETMKKRALAYSLALCFLLMATISLAAQDDVKRQSGSSNSGYLGYRVEQGDTVYYDAIDPVWVFPKGRGSSKELKQYYKLVYNFNKVYPYAMVAKDLIKEADDYMAANHFNRRQREKYINSVQKELFNAYEQPLRHMTFSQGRLLVKLIDREIGKTPYKIIKQYKNGIMAGFWQGVAKIFKNDLKKNYDPQGEDKMTEYLVEKWQKGEFDALYYSIFYEMPKHPKLASAELNKK